jgi:prevent-host-death family protein
MDKPVNIHEAKTHLSRLIERVEAGEEITLARAGRPVARLTPIRQVYEPRQPGIWKGKVWFATDWDSPEVNAEIADEFGA